MKLTKEKFFNLLKVEEKIKLPSFNSADKIFLQSMFETFYYFYERGYDHGKKESEAKNDR